MKIKVLRSFIHNGDPVEVGSVIDVSDAFAQEMVGLNKAERVDAAAPSGALSTRSAGALVPGHKPGESTATTPTQTVPGSTAEQVEKSIANPAISSPDAKTSGSPLPVSKESSDSHHTPTVKK